MYMHMLAYSTQELMPPVKEQFELRIIVWEVFIYIVSGSYVHIVWEVPYCTPVPVLITLTVLTVLTVLDQGARRGDH